MSIELGDLVEDVVTKFRGIVIMKYVYFHGTTRLLVQPQCDDVCIMPESHAFESSQLIVIKRYSNLKGV